jgi:hypothetical protein
VKELSTDSRPRLPVILLDRSGYSLYQDPAGRNFIPTDRYFVRLVTDISRLDEARGAELESVVAVPGGNDEAMAHAVRSQYEFGGRRAARLVAVTERLLLPAARLREELGIPGPSMAETLLFRDKLAMKRYLRERGVRVPDCAPFSLDAVEELWRTHPVLVVKPRMGAGSEGISVLRRREDLAQVLAASSGRQAELEVEAFVSGPLFHVDSVVQEGKVVAATAGRYLDATTSYRTLTPLRGIAVPPGPVLEELLAFNREVLSCYPEFSGVTHHEIFLTDTGPCLCEIAARAGGTGVAAGFWSRTGTNLHEIAIQAQLDGCVPDLIQVSPHLTGWVVLYAGPGVVREPIPIPEEPWVVQARALASAGTRREAPVSVSDGVALVSVRGDTEAEVIDRLTEVIARTAVRVSPDG